MDKTSLGTRMKENYEFVSQTKLLRRTPVIIRLDGKAFHTLTRGMKRPFDDDLIDCMTKTTQSLVKNIEGCQFSYTQSDEISLLLTDYSKIETQAWFDYKVQKVVSIAASMATAYFNHEFMAKFPEKYDKSPAFFDARCFNVPKEEVVNYFIFRQQDCTRNSIQMVGQANFSSKELHSKSCDQIQEMLWSSKGINWNDIETFKKRGTSVYKRSIEYKREIGEDIGYAGTFTEEGDDITIYRNEYFIDKDIPVFTQDRNFIQKWVDVE